MIGIASKLLAQRVQLGAFRHPPRFQLASRLFIHFLDVFTRAGFCFRRGSTFCVCNLISPVRYRARHRSSQTLKVHFGELMYARRQLTIFDAHREIRTAQREREMEFIYQNSLGSRLLGCSIGFVVLGLVMLLTWLMKQREERNLRLEVSNTVKPS